MPEEVDECVDSLMDEGHDEQSAWAICEAQNKAEEEGIRDLQAVKAVTMRKVADEWPGAHPAEKTQSGREQLLDSYGDFVGKVLDKMKSERTIKFKANLKSDEDMHVLYKADDGRMLIWGPASVDVVDKENDRITTEALKDALPQLMRRERLSLEHTDQLVGDIKEKHEFDEPKTVEVDGETIERSEFPTDVLKEDDGVPHDGLYVAGEVWEDTKQAQETQEDIENGIIDSYSISGEAIESSTRVKGGELVDDIKSIDLSAVTLCEEGMNQKAKFAQLAKSGRARETLQDIAAKAMDQRMSKAEDEDGEGGVGEDDSADNVSEAFSDDEQKALKSLFEDVVKNQLPDGDLATKDDVPGDDELQEKFQEFSESGEEKSETDSTILALADEYGVEPGEVTEALKSLAEGKEEEDEVDPDEIEDPDDDDEEELDIDAGEDEEMPPEEEKEGPGDDLDDEDDEMPVEVDDDEEDDDEVDMPEEDDMVESAHDVSLETLKNELPDDLYNSVAEHLTDPGMGEVKSDDGDDEDDESEEDDEEEKAETADFSDEGDMEKAASDDFDNYVASVTASAAPSADEETDLSKSFEGDDLEVEEDEEGNLADDFYKNVEDGEIEQ